MNQPALTTAAAVAAVAARIPMKYEDAPPFGAGAMPADKERTFAMLAHLFPLVFWFWKRRDSPVVDAHGKEALNFVITAAICLFPVSFIAGFLGLVVAKIYSLVLMVVSAGLLALVVFAMLKARDGRILRYPVNFRLIK